MLDGILVSVVEPCEVRLLVGKARFTIIVPHLSSGCIVQAVQPFGRFLVQLPEHAWQSLRRAGRAVRHEVVMIGKHGPRLKPPIEITGQGEQPTVKDHEPFARAKEVLVLVRGGSDEVSAIVGKAMFRRVRPGWRFLRHDEELE